MMFPFHAQYDNTKATFFLSREFSGSDRFVVLFSATQPLNCIQATTPCEGVCFPVRPPSEYHSHMSPIFGSVYCAIFEVVDFVAYKSQCLSQSSLPSFHNMVQSPSAYALL